MHSQSATTLEHWHRDAADALICSLRKGFQYFLAVVVSAEFNMRMCHRRYKLYTARGAVFFTATARSGGLTKSARMSKSGGVVVGCAIGVLRNTARRSVGVRMGTQEVPPNLSEMEPLDR